MNTLGHILWETHENSALYYMALSKSSSGLSTRNLTCILLFNILNGLMRWELFSLMRWELFMNEETKAQRI